MSSTFAERLTGSDGRDLRLAFVVQGVPYVFQQGRTSLINAVVALAGYGVGTSHTRFFGVGKIEQAAKEIDIAKRRMIGGSLTVDLQDDTAGTLQTLFSPRRRRSAFLAANVTTATASFTVSSSAPFTGGVPAYVGGETVLVDTVPGPATLDLSIRGAFGSVAQPHFGGSEQGAGLFLSPPSWIGRRVKLIAYFERDDGTTTAELATVLDTFRLEEAPKYTGNGCWQLQCSHLSDEVAARKLGVGLRDHPVSTGRSSYGDSAGLAWPGMDATLLVQGSRRTQLLINPGGDEAGIFDILTVSTDIATSFHSRVEPWNIPRQPTAARHIAVLSGDSIGVLTLVALCSRVGLGANGVYDQLGGFARTTHEGREFRLGAGIDAADIDTAAFLSIGAANGWEPVIDQEIDVGEFLADFCLVTESFWLVTADGLLSVKPMGGQEAAVMAIGDAVIIGEPDVTYDESRIAPRVNLQCNYDPVSGDFEGEVNLLDVEAADFFPTHTEALTIKSKLFVVEPQAIGGGTLKRAPRGLTEIEVLLRQAQGGGRGPVRVAFPAHLDVLLLDLGDVVDLSVAVPDFASAGTTTQEARVISIGPNYDAGDVDLVVELIPEVLAIAPAAVVASAAGTVLTLQTTGPEVSSATPGRMFAVGQGVALYDVSANVVVNNTVASLTDTTVTLTAALGFVVQAGVDFLTVVKQSSISGVVANTTGQTPTDYTYQMPSDENAIVLGGAAATFATRWR